MRQRVGGLPDGFEPDEPPAGFEVDRIQPTASAAVLPAGFEPDEPPAGFVVDGPTSANERRSYRSPWRERADQPGQSYGGASWGETLGKVPGAVGRMFERQWQGIQQQRLERYNDVMSPEDELEFLRHGTKGADLPDDFVEEIRNRRQRDLTQAQERATELGKEIAAMRPDVDPWSAKGLVYDFLVSMANMGPALAVTMLTRNPASGMSLLGSQVFGDQYATSREKGRTHDEATQDGVFMAAAEAIPEAVPLGILAKPGTTFVSRFFKGTVAEGIQEMFTQALQDGYEVGVLHEDMTWGEALENMARAGLLGAGMGATMAGVTEPFVRGERGAGEAGPAAADPPAGFEPDADLPEGAVPAEEVIGSVEPTAPETVAPEPIAPEPVAQPKRTAPITPEDEASPLPTADISRGKAVIDDAVSGRPLDMDRPTELAEAPRQAASQPAPGDGSGLEMVDPDSIAVDAQRFQFKSGGDAEGVTDQLRGVRTFNPDFAGVVVVWEANDGQRFIVDGHQRLALAKRAKAGGQRGVALRARVLREADGVTADRAMFRGAMKNLAEGGESTNAVDIARLFRNGGSREEAARHIPPARRAYRDGEALANLGDDAWGMTVNETVPANFAAVVGRTIQDPGGQVAALGYLAKHPPGNINQARMIVDQIDAAGFARQTQDSLFGEEALTGTLIAERAKILDAATRHIRGLRRVFTTAVDSAGILAEAGNVLDKDANRAQLSENAQLGPALEKLATRKGPVSDALTEAARSFHGGATLAQARDRFLETVRELDSLGEGRGAPGRGVDDRPAEPEVSDQEVGPPQSVREIRSGQAGWTPDRLVTKSRLAQQELNRVASGLGAEWKGGRPKTAESIRRKIAAKYQGDASRITDAARGTFVVETPQEADRLVAALFDVFPAFDKGWSRNANSGWFDRKVLVRTGNGTVAEIQFQSPEMAKARDAAGHDLYTVARDEGRTPAEKAEANEMQRALYSAAADREADSWIPIISSLNSGASGYRRANVASSTSQWSSTSSSQASWGSRRQDLPSSETTNTAVLDGGSKNATAGSKSQEKNSVSIDNSSTQYVDAAGESDKDGVTATETTDQGEQTLIPGVAPVTDRDRAQAGADRPLAGGDRPADFGLFDVAGRGQTDLVQRAQQPPSKTEPETTPKTPAPEAGVSDSGRKRDPSSDIQDFGETLEGARKDVWRSMIDSLQDAGIDLAAAPLSKSFPKPDYVKLAKEGVSGEAMAMVALMRNAIPSKPRRSYKVGQWVKQVELLREFSSGILTGKYTPQTIREKIDGLRYMSALRHFPDTADMVGGLDPETIEEGAKYQLRRTKFIRAKGEHFPDGKLFYHLETPRRGGYANIMTQEKAEAIGAAREYIRRQVDEQAAKPRQRLTPVGVYRDRNTKDVFVGFKAKRGVIRVKTGFETVKAAHEYIAERRDEIQATIDEMRKAPAVRRPENMTRKGPDRREGDVTPERFEQAFRFRGVQFGNYVEGGRRQKDLNEAFDALMDLSQALNIPPEALSLGGKLGLAFGARGRGGNAAAHYEPWSVVINLTKTQGAGSLAHEWFHAVDDYFGKMDAPAKEDRRYLTEEARAINRPQGVRPEVFEAFSDLRKALIDSSLSERSRQVDALRTSGDYWSKIIEMGARSFEKYIVDRMAKEGVENDYLANLAHSGMYPTESELQAEGIGPAFDRLFETIKIKDEGGRKVMFQVGPARPKTVAENLRRGLDAINEVLRTKQDQAAAMYRSEVGWIDFVWGNERGGIHHVIVGRNEKDGIDGRSFAARLPDVIARGGFGPFYLEKGTLKRNVIWGENTAVIGLKRGGNVMTWIVTGSPGRKAIPRTGRAITDAEAQEHIENMKAGALGEGGRRSSQATQQTPSAKGRSKTPKSESLGAAKADISPTEAGIKARAAAGKILGRIAKDAPVEIRDRLSTDQGREAYGQVLDGVISLSLASPDIEATARHEAIHFLRETGRIGGQDWRVLARAAKSEGWLDRHRIAERYPNLDGDAQIEEAVAEAYAQWAAGRYEAGNRILRAFKILKRVFDRVRAAIERALDREPSWQDLFIEVETGTAGARPAQATGSGEAKDSVPPPPDDGTSNEGENLKHDETPAPEAGVSDSGLREGEQRPTGETADPDGYVDLWDDAYGVLRDAEGLEARVAAADAWVLEKGQATGHEYLIMLDADGRLIQAGTQNEPGAVSYSGAVLDRLQAADTPPMIATHNHPRGASLSIDDLLVLASPGVDGIRVVTGDEVFTATMPDGVRQAATTSADSLRRAMNRVTTLLRNRIKTAVNDGRLDDLEAEIMEAHARNLLFHRLGLITYRSTMAVDALSAEYISVVESTVRPARQALGKFNANRTEQSLDDVPDRLSEFVRPDRGVGSLRGRGEGPAGGRAGGEGRTAGDRGVPGAREDARNAEDPSDAGGTLREDGGGVASHTFLAEEGDNLDLPPEAVREDRGVAAGTAGAAAQRQSMMGRLFGVQPIDRVMRLPFDVFGGVNDQGQWQPGLWLSAKAEQAIAQAQFNEDGPMAWMNPMLHRARAGLIDRYGLDPDYVERDMVRALDERRIQSEIPELMQTLQSAGIGPGEAKVLQAVMTGEVVPDEEMAQLSEPIRNAIDHMGQEAVNLGLLSPDAFERNRGKYLHRVYEKHENDQSSLTRWVSRMAQSRRRKIIGNQFKGRGLWIEVPQTKLRDDARPERDTGAGALTLQNATKQGDTIRVLDRVANDGQGEMEDRAPGRRRKVLDRVYIPADQPVPAKYRDYQDQGMWEVRGAKKGKVTLWRDFTKAERADMGEIVDARYTIAKTYMGMAHDLATGRFYRDIAQNEEWSRADEPREGTWKNADNYWRFWADPAIDWVKVPDTKLEKSGTARYGQLAGRYVRAEIWRDLNEVERMQKANWWDQLTRQWKLNKTARSPVVHMNNVMSNVLLMDMADVRAADLARAIRAMYRKDGDYKQAVEGGAFGSDMMSVEIRDNVLKPLLEEIERDMQGGQDSMEAKIGLVGKLLDRIWRMGRRADRAAIDLYRLEDEVFRMATYLRRRDQGYGEAEAAREAREQFLNYDIRAPWVNAARRTVLPFIAYTYRAVPIIAKSMAHRPWKLLKYATVAYAANALAYTLEPGDEDEERRSMRSEEQGYTWVGGPRMMRLAMRDEYGNPLFIDMRRWVPAGDVFDMNQGASAIPIPSWLQFGGPIMIAGELMLNKQGFTGQEITNEYTDTTVDKISKTADYLWKAFMPSAAWIPGSWYWTKIGEAATGVRDWQGRRYSIGQAAMSSVGVKVRPQDVEAGFYDHQRRFNRTERELMAQARRIVADYDRGRISVTVRDQRMADLATKIERLDDRRLATFEGR